MNILSRLLLTLLNRTDEAVMNGAVTWFDYAVSWNPGQRSWGISTRRTDSWRSMEIDVWTYTFHMDIAVAPTVAIAGQGSDIN